MKYSELAARYETKGEQGRIAGDIFRKIGQVRNEVSTKEMEEWLEEYDIDTEEINDVMGINPDEELDSDGPRKVKGTKKRRQTFLNMGENLPMDSDHDTTHDSI